MPTDEVAPGAGSTSLSVEVAEGSRVRKGRAAEGEFLIGRSPQADLRLGLGGDEQENNHFESTPPKLAILSHTRMSRGESTWLVRNECDREAEVRHDLASATLQRRAQAVVHPGSTTVTWRIGPYNIVATLELAQDSRLPIHEDFLTPGVRGQMAVLYRHLLDPHMARPVNIAREAARILQRRPASEREVDKSEEAIKANSRRLRGRLNKQFADSGVHLENTDQLGDFLAHQGLITLQHVYDRAPWLRRARSSTPEDR